MSPFFTNPDPDPQFPFVVNAGASSTTLLPGNPVQLLPIGASGAGSLASAYVGNSAGLSIAVEMAGADQGLDPWLFAVVWSRILLDATSPWPGPFPSSDVDGNLVVIEAYFGDDTCAIFDNLPVIAPYASVWFGPQKALSVNGVGFGGGQVVGSSSTLRGPVALPLISLAGTPDGIAPGGYLISHVEAVPANTTRTLYSPVLAPGFHQAYLEADVAHPTDAAFAQLELPLDETPNLIISQATQNLAGVKQFQGQVLIPNVQPRIRLINDTAAAVNMAGQLTRPAGSSV